MSSPPENKSSSPPTTTTSRSLAYLLTKKVPIIKGVGLYSVPFHPNSKEKYTHSFISENGMEDPPEYKEEAFFSASVSNIIGLTMTAAGKITGQMHVVTRRILDVEYYGANMRRYRCCYQTMVAFGIVSVCHFNTISQVEAQKYHNDLVSILKDPGSIPWFKMHFRKAFRKAHGIFPKSWWSANELLYPLESYNDRAWPSQISW